MRLATMAASLLMLAVFAIGRPAHAASVTVAWNGYPPDAGPVPDGFRLYYGPDATFDGVESAAGPSPIDIPMSSLPDPSNPSFLLDGLSSCSSQYFGLSAYVFDGDGGILESTVTTLADAITVVQRPLNVAATSSVPGGVHITWDALPANDHGAIPDYDIHYGDQDDADAGQPIDGTGATEGASPVDVPSASLANASAPDATLTGLAAATYFVSVDSRCADASTKVSTQVQVVVVGTTTTTTTSTGTSTSVSSTSTGTSGSSGSVASTGTAGPSAASSSASSSAGSTGSTATATTTTGAGSTSTHGSTGTHGSSASSTGGTTTGGTTTGGTTGTHGSTSSASASGGAAAGATGGSGDVPQQIDGSCGCASGNDVASLGLLLAVLGFVGRRRVR